MFARKQAGILCALAAAVVAAAMAAPPAAPVAGAENGVKALGETGIVPKNVDIRASAGKIAGYRQDGVKIWEMTLADEQAAPTWTWIDDRFIELDNGYVIDPRDGRAVSCKVKGLTGKTTDEGGKKGGSTKGRDGAYWDTPQTSSGTPIEVLFENNAGEDGLRRAWAFATGDNYSLVARRSTGHDSFGDSTTVLSSYSDAAISIDSSDNITVVAGSTSRVAVAARYEAETGWSSEVELYPNVETFDTVGMAADVAGNVIALFSSNAGNSSGIDCLIYDVASDAWIQGPLPEYGGCGSMRGLTLVGNQQGTAIYAIYARCIQRSGWEWLIFANRFDIVTREWSAPQVLPGSYGYHWTESILNDPLMAVVDGTGEATVIWIRQRSSGLYDIGSVCASRTAGGVWQAPVELVSLNYLGYLGYALSNFGDINVNENGDVLVAFTAPNKFNSAQPYRAWLHTLRYRAGTGWEAAQHCLPYDTVVITRTRAAFYEDDKAVATSLTDDGGTLRLVSLLYDGTTWSSEYMELPTTGIVYEQKSAGAQGTSVLFYTIDGGSTQTTWLRDAP